MLLTQTVSGPPTVRELIPRRQSISWQWRGTLLGRGCNRGRAPAPRRL